MLWLLLVLLVLMKLFLWLGGLLKICLLGCGLRGIERGGLLNALNSSKSSLSFKLVGRCLGYELMGDGDSDSDLDVACNSCSKRKMTIGKANVRKKETKCMKG